MMRRKSSGIALLAILLVGIATLLQMMVDWHQQAETGWDPVVKAGILAAGGLSLLAIFLALLGGGKS